MVSKAFFVLRLNDHIQYLKKIEATLAGKAEFEGTDCQACKLGKWMYNEGKQEIATFSEKHQTTFNSLFEPHERFHQISKDALDKHKAGDAEGARKATTEMYVLSNLLSQRLLDLDKP